MVRKRSEHNEGEICTLEEVALHQEDIEKIEHLQNWCRELKILLLQSNLISKIENVNKLKKLEYLNLALNNIERIENLAGCESLNKLDLTLNFVGEITSVGSLRANEFLRELYLTGNPCCDFVGYREYVIGSLPQLTSLDGKSIEPTDHILARQALEWATKSVLAGQRRYLSERARQKTRSQPCQISELPDSSSDEARLQAYWQAPSEHSPETRVEIAQAIRKSKEVKPSKDPLAPPKRTYRFFTDSGRPLNVNQAKLDLSLTELEDRLELDIAVYRHLDSAHVTVDVQPTYVRATVKGKVLQVVLPEEVLPHASTAQRSATTGHLVLSMPRAKGTIGTKPSPKPGQAKPKLGQMKTESGQVKPESAQTRPKSAETGLKSGQVKPESGQVKSESGQVKPESGQTGLKSGQAGPRSGQVKPEPGQTMPEPGQSQPYSRREFLEIGAEYREVDLARIVERAEARKATKTSVSLGKKREDVDFEDDPEVPPLE